MKKHVRSATAIQKTASPRIDSSETRFYKQTHTGTRKNVQNSPCVTEKSEKIVKKIKLTRYKEIFEDLLPDIKGCINKETIYKSNLPDKIKHIVKPLIDEIEEFDESLNFKEFCDAMEVLLKFTSPADKSLLLKTSKPKPAPDYLSPNNPRRTPSRPRVNKVDQDPYKLSPYKS
jgi:predicted house-cleaning noncanonical NTP pyrophosphatase (MazG superfamily)